MRIAASKCVCGALDVRHKGRSKEHVTFIKGFCRWYIMLRII